MALPRLVLASSSPQRRAILEQLGIEFEVVAPDVEEATGGPPEGLVVENALRKARAVAAALGPGGGRRILGVDTAVVLSGRAYGKPRDEGEARDFLEALGGRGHEVWSGIALLATGADPREPEARTAAAVTRVWFRRLDPGQIEWYLASGEWRGRAGGYAIQGRGAALVERIAGDYWNVVGLPLPELLRLAPDLLSTWPGSAP